MVASYNKEIMSVEVGMLCDSAKYCRLFLTNLITKGKADTNNKTRGNI